MKEKNMKESFETETDNSDNTQNSNKDVIRVVEKIFKNANLNILAIFLVVYLIVFIGFGLYLGENQERTIKNTFDILMFCCFAVYLIFQYFTVKSEGKNYINSRITGFIELYDDELALFYVMLFVVCFYLMLFLLRIPSNSNRPVSVSIISAISWFLLATLTIHNCLKYFFDIDLLANLRDNDYTQYLEDVMNEENNVNAQSSDISGGDVEVEPEVFNISNNLYTYQDAQAVCQSMDSRLANYDEIEKAYNNGAEWCTYGWSADQLALFPTQKESWNKLQGDCKSKNKCGRPGINGGYFRNPNIKFGVNCFGIKPTAKQSDLNYMEFKKTQPFPRTEQEKHMDDKVEYWKKNIDKIVVNSFNKDKWSRY